MEGVSPGISEHQNFAQFATPYQWAQWAQRAQWALLIDLMRGASILVIL